MEIKEAIEHAEQKAQDLNCSCRADHWQLAQWLKELDARREVDKTAVTKQFLEKIMELKDTIPLMTSDDYRDRLRAEYFQLKIRTQRLDLAIQSGNFPPAITLVMKGQRNHMINYMSMLVYRAWLEGITLED